MTKQLLMKLGCYANQQQLSIDEYTKLIEKAQKIKNTINGIKLDQEIIIQDAKQKTIRLDEDIIKIQTTCIHEIGTFNQGCQGIRSYYECDLCGKEVNK